jgi:predicted GH43/DUF377 family glycosyl hydrolase
MKRKTFVKISSLLSASALIGRGVATANITPGSTSRAVDGGVSFWDIFSDNYRQNCKAWKHNTEKNPVIPAGQQAWGKFWTANPAILIRKADKLIYYRGNGITPTNTNRHDRIGVARIKSMSDNHFEYEILNGGNFIIDVGPKGSFDDSDVLDPGVVEFNGKVYLYYSGVGTGPHSVGLAISSDGVSFEKHGSVLVGRSPSVVVADNKIYMIYQNDTGKGFKGFFLAESGDGINFRNISDEPVLVGQENGWDRFVTTARIYREDDAFLLLYGGSPDMNDQPDYFGLARSSDLRTWQKHPGNPIFGLGAKGEEDGGAVWFPALIDTGSHYVILYEGSRGRYSWDLSSQICMSSIARKTIKG